MEFKLGGIKTGPAGGLKLDSINAAHESIKQEQADKAEMAKATAKVATGTIIYTTVGNNVFNCISKKHRIRINFTAGKYILAPDTKNKADIEDTLEYFVEQDRIVREDK